ncbi:leucine-rich repeat domain-containing protein [Spirillospora sp. CA-108201]
MDAASRSPASVREQIVHEHELLAATEAFAFFLERVDAPETDLAREWDAYLAHRDEARTRARERGRTALERFDRRLASLPIDEALRAVAADTAFWHPGTAAVREQRVLLNEPDVEQRLLAAIFGEPLDEPGASHRERARERLERARLAAEERDYERWRADLPPGERHAHPARGNPARYAYARAPRLDVSRPPERSVEWAIRSQTGVGEGPIPEEALDAVDGLSLTLHQPADLTPLGRLRNLSWLSVHSTVPVDLVTLASTLRPARELRDLTIDAPVGDITPLARLTQLRNLRLEHTHVTDVGPLADLTQLSDLSVCDGPLSDLTPLSGLRLGRLFVYRTRVSDLSPLSGMPTLTVLGLAGCPVRDLTVVTTLPALHFVNLRGTPITDLGDLPERAPEVTFEGVNEHAGDEAGTRETTAASAGAGAPAEPVPDALAADLLAEFRTVGDDHARRGRLERAMLAGRRLDLVQEIIGDDFQSAGSTVVGLLLTGAAGDVPFPDNPWGIPPAADLTQALRQVWEPVAGLAPRFVRTVHDRTLGLALLIDESGTHALGYFTWRSDRGVDAPAGLDQFADPARDHHLSLVIGSAPHAADPTAVMPLLAGPVPLPIRDFWAVHHVLDTGFDRIGGGLDCNTLEFFADDGWSVVAERLDGHPPDRFVHSVGNGNYDIYVLDLDMLDSAGNPTVAHWAFKEREIGDHKQYWEWLDGTGADLIFRP